MMRPLIRVALAIVIGSSWIVRMPPGWAVQTEGESRQRQAEGMSDEEKFRIWDSGLEPGHPELLNPQHTGPALTIQLAPDETLVVPPHLANQKIYAVYDPYFLSGLGDCVLVGLNAWTGGKQIPQAYVLVYSREDEAWRLKAELPLRMHFVRMETLELGEKTVLVIYGHSGMHFTDLWVYTFDDGTPRLLLQTGSAAGVFVRPAMGGHPAAVWVGIEDWDDPAWSYASKDPLWNVHVWDGEQFAFSDELSTTRQTSVEERTQGYVNRVMEAMEEAER